MLAIQGVVHLVPIGGCNYKKAQDGDTEKVRLSSTGYARTLDIPGS